MGFTVKANCGRMVDGYIESGGMLGLLLRCAGVRKFQS